MVLLLVPSPAPPVESPTGYSTASVLGGALVQDGSQEVMACGGGRDRRFNSVTSVLVLPLVRRPVQASLVLKP